MSTKKKYRTEKDVMGSVKVPKDAYYGIHVVRASKNFPISDQRIHPELNKAITQIKISAAKANMDLGFLQKRIGKAMIRACKEILRGKFDDQFIIDVYQAGAGTPWHMNVNEVITNRALELLGKKKGDYSKIHHHNHPNMGQSTNDVMPSSMRIAAIKLTDHLIPVLKELVKSLKQKSVEFKNLAKAGRTHLRDAAPVTLGQEFKTWADALFQDIRELQHARGNLLAINIGGTAVGTGINTHPNFGKMIVSDLRKQTGLDLKSAKNKMVASQFMNDFLELSAALQRIATTLTKVCNDLRLLSSGPHSGFNELSLPKVEPGSSIMPAKFNPSMAEMLHMVCYQIMGNDETIRRGSAAGQLELNVMTPVIAHNLYQSLELLRNGVREFDKRCVRGIKANTKVLKTYFEASPEIAVALNPKIGYENVAKIVKEAVRTGKTARQIILKKKILSKKELDKLFRPKNITKPNLRRKKNAKK